MNAKVIEEKLEKFKGRKITPLLLRQVMDNLLSSIEPPVFPKELIKVDLNKDTGVVNIKVPFRLFLNV